MFSFDCIFSHNLKKHNQMKKLILVAAIFTLLIACEKSEINNDESKEVILQDSDQFLIEKDGIQEEGER